MKVKLEVSLAAILLLAATCCSRAQSITNPLPVVTIHGTHDASESGIQGVFTLFRDGPTNNALNVLYMVGGTASNGVDYTLLPSVATIPAGVRTASIIVNPIDDLLV